MKKLVVGSLAIGMMALPAMAGPSAFVTPIGGTVGTDVSFSTGGQHDILGHTYNFPGGGGAGPSAWNLYDGVPTFLGGTASPGMFGPFMDVPGTFLFIDWSGPTSQWGDGYHEVSDGIGPGPAVVTSLFYGYSATTNPNQPPGALSHVIKIYDMVPPSVPHTTTGGATFVTITKGALLTQITLAGLPTGQNFVTVDVSSAPVHLVNDAIWVKFEELPTPPGGPGGGGTFWMTGGVPLNGYSHPGVTLTAKDYVYTTINGYQYPPYTYNYFTNFPYFSFTTANYATYGGLYYVGSNVVLGLKGYNVPGPAAISLLGLGGLVALRRRRAR